MFSMQLTVTAASDVIEEWKSEFRGDTIVQWNAHRDHGMLALQREQVNGAADGT
jgi:hypothetical protein